MTREELNKLIMQACERTWNEKTCKEIEQALSQEPCDYTGNEFFNFDAPIVKKSMEQESEDKE